MELRNTGEDAFFAASNGKNGFQSYYAELFDRKDIVRVYAVKGGPGTGKSRFLREASEEGRKRGYRSETVYCSSDPDSLDAVILKKDGAGIAFLDATAPHVYEPKRPGVREEIVNLGDFWNPERLLSKKEEIEKYNMEKERAYRMAYRYLSSYGELTENRTELVDPHVKKKALASFAKRLLRALPDGPENDAKPALFRSVGLRGEVGLDTYFAKAKQIWRVEDCRGVASLFLSDVGRELIRKQKKILVSHDPILPDVVDGYFLVDEKIAIVSAKKEDCPYPHRTVTLRRFLDTRALRKHKNALTYTERMRRAMLEGAIESLKDAKKAHFALEEIYTSAMDFEKKETFTKAFLKRVFDLQKEE